MREHITLPELEANLDRLEPGQVVYISHQEFTHLFGVNDAARSRLKNFASAHSCSTNWDRTGLRFVRSLRRELE